MNCRGGKYEHFIARIHGNRRRFLLCLAQSTALRSIAADPLIGKLFATYPLELDERRASLLERSVGA
jgi:hypothetical protein